MPRLLVIGGMAAGMSAASKVKRTRPEWEATVLEAGPDLSYGACGLPYYLGGEVGDASDLYALSQEEIAKRGIEVKLRQRAVSLAQGRKQLEVEDLPSGRRRNEPYDALLIATGAMASLPDLRGLSGENLFTLHDFTDGRRLKSFIDQNGPRSALVWGSGYIGLEMAENLARRGIAVTLINRSTKIMRTLCPPLASRLIAEMEDKGVRVLLETRVVEVVQSHERIAAFETDRGRLSADLFLVATGVRPNTDFLKGSPLPMSQNGALKVDDFCATGIHGIWAAGDCCETNHVVTGRPVYLPMGTTANKMGRIAGANIAGGRERFPGVVGTAITRVFGLEAAVTGLSQPEAEAHGFFPVSVSIEAGSRAGYFPGGGAVSVHLVAGRDGRLLGGQIVAPEGTKGRIDALACAVTAGMKVDDFAYLDLSYAPPFAPVWDPLLVAAQALRSKL
ncbi:MAG: FAD-dependent oxidoreductase [Acidobacteria bacterium]|nr:FAD-dependent oxidoreductase [Acidobacteriota bacterium]